MPRPEQRLYGHPDDPSTHCPQLDPPTEPGGLPCLCTAPEADELIDLDPTAQLN
jgi:hypothetical protein